MNTGITGFLKIEIYLLFWLKIKTMKNYQFTAEITWDKELKQYIGIVPELPGAHTQASSLDELHIRLKEVIELCLNEI